MSPHYKHHFIFFFFFNDTATTEIYTLSLHDAFRSRRKEHRRVRADHGRRILGEERRELRDHQERSEEHTSELQSRRDLVCRLLLEKKKKITDHAFFFHTLYQIHGT